PRQELYMIQVISMHSMHILRKRLVFFKKRIDYIQYRNQGNVEQQDADRHKKPSGFSHLHMPLKNSHLSRRCPAFCAPDPETLCENQ
ncbi:MAG: hypothetical protein KKB35_08050, partial [Proteobacteria bacterium]|nr:hypothetical protein [Pseudomonadota bacterium]